MYGMDESSKQLKKFEESGNDTEFLKHAYGFINGFYKGVDIPQPLRSQIAELRENLDVHYGSLTSGQDMSGMGWGN